MNPIGDLQFHFNLIKFLFFKIPHFLVAFQQENDKISSFLHNMADIISKRNMLDL